MLSVLHSRVSLTRLERCNHQNPPSSPPLHARQIDLGVIFANAATGYVKPACRAQAARPDGCQAPENQCFIWFIERKGMSQAETANAIQSNIIKLLNFLNKKLAWLQVSKDGPDQTPTRTSTHHRPLHFADRVTCRRSRPKWPRFPRHSK